MTYGDYSMLSNIWITWNHNCLPHNSTKINHMWQVNWKMNPSCWGGKRTVIYNKEVLSWQFNDNENWKERFSGGETEMSEKTKNLSANLWITS